MASLREGELDTAGGTGIAALIFDPVVRHDLPWLVSYGPAEDSAPLVTNKHLHMVPGC